MRGFQILPALARKAVAAALRGETGPDVEDLPAELLENGAAFVTLLKRGELRGCIGSLEAHRPLAWDVIENAQRAAFYDPRFPPVEVGDLPEIQFEVSVLTAPEPFPVRDEADLLAKLKPGEDGLILRDGSRRATFLPAVWEDLPDPRAFVMHLKRKAGLPTDYWSGTMEVERYQAVKVAE